MDLQGNKEDEVEENNNQPKQSSSFADSMDIDDDDNKENRPQGLFIIYDILIFSSTYLSI